MSFYNVGPTNKFVVQNEDLYTQQHIDFLEAGFNQGPVGTSLNSLDATSIVTLSANAIVNAQYIEVTGTSAITTATALEIVTELNKNQSIRELSTSSSAVTVGKGFNFNIMLKVSGNTTFTAGTGVTNKGGFLLDAGVNVLKVIVTNATATSAAAAVSFVKLA
jgi:hypothetical protein